MSFLIKICGITNSEDAVMVSEAGADYLGVLVNVVQSPRSLTVEKAQEVIASSRIPTVVLTCNHTLEEMLTLVRELAPHAIQLVGNETAEEVSYLKKRVSCYIWKSLYLPSSGANQDLVAEIVAEINTFAHAGVDCIVLDTLIVQGVKVGKGGTGKVCDWFLAREIRSKVKPTLLLAGGITPDNVKDALVHVKPDGIDLSSGVERSPGKKDPQRVSRLVSAVKSLEQENLNG